MSSWSFLSQSEHYIWTGVLWLFQWLGCPLDTRGIVFRFLRGKEFFLFVRAFRSTLGPNQLTVYWVPGVKPPGPEADHLHLVLSLKMGGAVPPLPICLYGMHRDQLNFTFSRVISRGLTFFPGGKFFRFLADTTVLTDFSSVVHSLSTTARRSNCIDFSPYA
jgi:hypothetical protein